jgi:hypothetical protein
MFGTHNTKRRPGKSNGYYIGGTWGVAEVGGKFQNIGKMVLRCVGCGKVTRVMKATSGI